MTYDTRHGIVKLFSYLFYFLVFSDGSTNVNIKNLGNTQNLRY